MQGKYITWINRDPYEYAMHTNVENKRKGNRFEIEGTNY